MYITYIQILTKSPLDIRQMLFEAYNFKQVPID